MQQATLRTPRPIHGRPAYLIGWEASSVQSAVRLRYEDKIVDAKRVMDVLLLGVPAGSWVEVMAEGPDERDVIDALTRLFESGFLDRPVTTAMLEEFPDPAHDYGRRRRSL